MLMLDQVLHRRREAAMNDAKKLAVMEVEICELRSLFRETAASAQKIAQDLDLVKAAVTHCRVLCAFEEEMGRMEGIERSLGKQEGEWKSAIGELSKTAKQERAEVSRLRGLLGNIEARHEQRREMVVRQGVELVECRPRNSELGKAVQQLKEENRRLLKSSEELKGQLARVQVGQQSVVAVLQEAIAAGRSKLNQHVANMEGDLAKLKEDIRRMKTTKQFPPWLEKGKEFDVPDGIIAHLTRECRGNVHDRQVVAVTAGSSDETAANDNDDSKKVADLEIVSHFYSVYREKKEGISHTRNNWVCYDFKERRIVYWPRPPSGNVGFRRVPTRNPKLDSIGCPTPSIAQANLTIKINGNILRSFNSSDILTIYLHAFCNRSIHRFAENCVQDLPRDFRQNNPNTNKKFRWSFSAIFHQLSSDVVKRKSPRVPNLANREDDVPVSFD
jgi:hypothetical protein